MTHTHITQQIDTLSPRGILKKFKKHEREALLPLYQEHTQYLLRVLKTIAEVGDNPFLIEKFALSIPSWESVATCHEIALNSLRVLTIETHQNPKGREREYTNHQKAKNISRDRRVRLIWRLLYQELLQNPSLEGIEPYDDLVDISRKSVICPFCAEVVFAQNEDGIVFAGCEHLYYIHHGEPLVDNWTRDELSSRMYDYLLDTSFTFEGSRAIVFEEDTYLFFDNDTDALFDAFESFVQDHVLAIEDWQVEEILDLVKRDFGYNYNTSLSSIVLVALYKLWDYELDGDFDPDYYQVNFDLVAMEKFGEYRWILPSELPVLLGGTGRQQNHLFGE